MWMQGGKKKRRVGEEGKREGVSFPFCLFSAPPPALFVLATWQSQKPSSSPSPSFIDHHVVYKCVQHSTEEDVWDNVEIALRGTIFVEF